MFKRKPKKVWVVMGWDEEPRVIFDTEAKARAFAKSQADYEDRSQTAEGESSDTYPFIYEYELNVIQRSEA